MSIKIEKVVRYEGEYKTESGSYEFIIDRFREPEVSWINESPEYYEDGIDAEIEEEILKEYKLLKNSERDE